MRFALAVLAAVAVAAMTTTPATAAPAGSTTTRIKFTTTLDSQQRVLEQVGRGGVKTYGWERADRHGVDRLR